MRRVLLADLVAVASRLALLPREDRPGVLARLIEQAHSAHKISRRLGLPHPLWGNGCLASAAARLPHGADGAGPDPDRLEALALVAEVVAWRIRQGRHQRRTGAPSSAVRPPVPLVREEPPLPSTVGRNDYVLDLPVTRKGRCDG
ncbi:hypothetical protein D0Z66_05085 [Cereibacter sphaeroides]|nr:hypothetical protein D0Z66_05085 [Cereibacter sphaeroides]